MTSSFTKILARHRGPYRLLVSLAPGPKGKPQPQEWIPTKTKDPVNDAFELLTQMGGAATSVQAWSEYEEQFVLTIVEADRATWDVEKLTWEADVKLAKKELTDSQAKPVKISAQI